MHDLEMMGKVLAPPSLGWMVLDPCISLCFFFLSINTKLFKEKEKEKKVLAPHNARSAKRALTW